MDPNDSELGPDAIVVLDADSEEELNLSAVLRVGCKWSKSRWYASGLGDGEGEFSEGRDRELSRAESSSGLISSELLPALNESGIQPARKSTTAPTLSAILPRSACVESRPLRPSTCASTLSASGVKTRVSLYPASRSKSSSLSYVLEVPRR